MPEFTPEYEALCRELALKRKFQPGDWMLEVVTVSGDQTRCYVLDRDGARFWRRAHPKYDGPGMPPIFWLPLDGDWDQMLVTAGCRFYYVSRLANGELQVGTMTGPFANASSVLEAKARLWMVLTGKEAAHV